MKWALSIIALGIVGTFALVPGDADPRTVGAAKSEPPVLGFDFLPVRRPLHSGANYPHGSGTLAELDPLTLRPVSRRLTIRGFAFGWDSSADGKRLALSTSERGRIQVIDLARMRSLWTFRVPVQQPVLSLHWLGPDRLGAVTDDAGAVAWELDAADGHVRARHDLHGSVVGVERLPDGFAVLLAPATGTGSARLAIVRAGARPRTVKLAGIQAGAPPRPAGHQELPSDAPPDLIPGLAVGDGAAWVIDPQAFRVARVDLESGTATMHDVGVTARAAKGNPVIERHGRWLDDGVLAVSGIDSASDRPFGLRVVDTTTWRARVLDADASVYDLRSADGVLLYPRFLRSPGRPPTVFGYEPTGRRRFAFRPRFGLSGVDVVGNFAYVRNGARRSGNRRIYVIDLRTGRAAATVRLRGAAGRPLQTRELMLLTPP